MAFITGGVAVVLAFAAAYLSLVRIPGMAAVGAPIPHWLQRMVMREVDDGDIRDSADNRDD
jgi:hypothetical protein